MFVSSYNTYIQTDSTVKSNKQRLEKPSSSSDEFAQKLSQKTPNTNFTSSPIPAEFISKSQAYLNKQELEFQKEQLKNPQNSGTKELKETLSKFTANNSLTSAKHAYENINKAFSVFPKQASSIDQTPKMDQNLPAQAHEAKELSMRHKMVNTYLANDRYYQVTA